MQALYLLALDPVEVFKKRKLNLGVAPGLVKFLAPDVESSADSYGTFLSNVALDLTQKTGQKCTAVRRIYVPADRFPSAYAEALCTSLQHCCAENTVTFDYNSCTAGWKGLIQLRFNDPNSAALANYDTKAASDCVARVHDARGVSCAPEPNSISDARNTCQLIFTGKKAPGAACTTSAECAPQDGAVVTCSSLPPGADGGGQLPLAHPLGEPVCVATPLPVQGAPCTITPPNGCQGDPALFCDPSALTCLPKGDVGGPCVPQADSCLPGAYCISGGPNNAICGAVLPIGSPCKTSIECDPSASCDAGSKTCVARKPPGSACAADGDCATGLCDTVAKKCLKNVIATTNACTGVGP
jgi:hypothetical protein